MKLRTHRWGSAVTALALFLVVPACDDKKEDKPGDTKGDKAADAKKAGGKAAAPAKADGAKAADAKADGGGAADAKADGGGAADAAPVDGGANTAPGAIGVKECDDYVVRYTKCIDEHYPESAREGTHAALKTASDAWLKAAATEDGKKGLVNACNNAAAAVKTICKW